MVVGGACGGGRSLWWWEELVGLEGFGEILQGSKHVVIKSIVCSSISSLIHLNNYMDG